MKTNKILFIVIIGLFVFFNHCNVYGQDEDNNSAFRIYSADISIGYYNPSMDYWNNEYFKEMKWENKFTGNITFAGDISLLLLKNTCLTIGYSYWNEKVKSGNIVQNNSIINEDIQLTLSNINIGIRYYPLFIRFDEFKPYFGLNGSIIFIRNNFTVTDGLTESSSITNYGQDYSGNISLGIERTIYKSFGMGIDCGYSFGKYTQKVTIDNVESEKDVSLNGFTANLHLIYFF